MLERIKRQLPSGCGYLPVCRPVIPKWALVTPSLRLTERSSVSLFVEKKKPTGCGDDGRKKGGPKPEGGVLTLYAPSNVPDFIARVCQKLLEDAASRKVIYHHLAEMHTAEWVFPSEEDRDALAPRHWPEHKLFNAATALIAPVDPDGGVHRQHCDRSLIACQPYEWTFIGGELGLHLTIWASRTNTGLEPWKFRLRFNPAPTHMELLAATANAYKCAMAESTGVFQLTARLPIDVGKKGILAAAKANGGVVALQASGDEPDVVARTIQYFIDADLTDFLRVGVECTWQVGGDGAGWPTALPMVKGDKWWAKGGEARRYTVPNCRVLERCYRVPVFIWPKVDGDGEGRVAKFQVLLQLDDLHSYEENADGGVPTVTEAVGAEAAKVAGAFRRSLGSLKRKRSQFHAGRSDASDGYPEI